MLGLVVSNGAIGRLMGLDHPVRTAVPDMS
jgi:hypothetical protein